MDTGYFQTVAEIAITLGGFSGLIATFHKTESTWTKGALTRISVLVFLTFAVLTFSLLPIALHKTMLPTHYIWTGCLVGWSLSALAVVGVMAIRTKQNTLTIELPFLTRFIVVVGILYHLACLPLALMTLMSEALLAIGLIWGLVYGGIVFYATLNHIWQASERG